MSVWGFLNRLWAGWSRNGKFHSQQEQNSELRIKNNVYCSTYLSEWDIVPAIHHVWFLQRRNIWSLHLSCHFVIMSEVCSYEVLQWPTEVKIATCKIWAEWSFNKLCAAVCWDVTFDGILGDSIFLQCLDCDNSECIPYLHNIAAAAGSQGTLTGSDIELVTFSPWESYRQFIGGTFVLVTDNYLEKLGLLSVHCWLVFTYVVVINGSATSKIGTYWTLLIVVWCEIPNSVNRNNTCHDLS